MNYGSVCSGIEAATVAWHPWKVTPLYAAPFAAPERGGTMKPLWIVNDLGELGVKVGTRFFFLYKGDNIEYGERAHKDGVALHDDGTPMQYRIVGKREFGETCQPLERFRSRWPGRYQEPVVFTPGLSFGKPEDGEWRPLPAAPAEGGTMTKEAQPSSTPATGVVGRLRAADARIDSEDQRRLYADAADRIEQLEREAVEGAKAFLDYHAKIMASIDRIEAKVVAAAPLSAIEHIIPDVDWLANVIRTNSGDHLNPIGAGTLAEKIVEAMQGTMKGKARRPETRQTCEWRQDSDGCYDTGCDHKFFFDTGTAEENGAKFCQYCGGAMKVIAYQEPPDEEAHVAEVGTTGGKDG